MALRRTKLGVMLLAVTALVGVATGVSTAVGGPSADQSDWRVVPDSEPQRDQALWQDVSAIALDDAWAVGLGRSYDVADGIAQHWDGTKWTRVDVPGTAEAELNGVDAVASDDVWAVGKQFQGKSWHWNGTAWREVAIPGPDPGQGSKTTNFFDVTAVGAKDVWAVGVLKDELVDPYVERPAIAHWTGTKWSRVAPPGLPGESRFNAVDAVSASRVWAVGSSTDPATDVSTAIAARWNGTAWKRIALPALPTDSSLSDVTVVGPGDIWAVGKADGHPIALHWNGSAWKLVATPASTGGLKSVTPDGNGGLWASGGSSEDVYDAGTTFYQHYDGSQWTEVADPAGADGALWGLDLVPSTKTVWSVGAEKSSGYENPDPGRIQVNGPLS